jgi:hypothetical protein
MLVEIEGVRQIPEEGPRRWFVDENIDLIIWYRPEGNSVTGFQICFDKKSVQRCLTWQRGEKGLPSTLSSDGPYSMKRVLRLFDAVCENLPEPEKSLILQCLKDSLRS